MSRDEHHGVEYEAEHVHAVYQEIASHFSSTRYKPWPIVESFLSSLEPGSVGLDIGCGNGKYLPINNDVFIIASDRSSNLVDIAAQHRTPHQAVVADTTALPHPESAFDFAISIAVVHHLSTPHRRVQAVREILATLNKSVPMRDGDLRGDKNGGRALIYVWALEQKGSRRGWDQGDEQDVMVPWVMKVKKRVEEGNNGPKRHRKKKTHMSSATDSSGNDLVHTDAQAEVEPPPHDKVFNRYYHLYRKGELEQDIMDAGGVVLESGYEKDNWWAIASRTSTVEESQTPRPV